MKILQLRFKNLNSLVGEWVIDFTAPDYVSDGIFAISGPTGSGKSTILDAICLALYGRTPRLKNISKTTNEIMSRQTGVCFTEVVFETSSGRFRTYWSQRRAREKADGLLQNPEHELSDATTGKVLTSKLTDTKSEVEKRTGMDYDRFVQSMMLAQGGFAAFLQASGNERAPILEQITGTEIYSHISKHVYDCYKNEKGVLDVLKAHMDGIALMQPVEEVQVRVVLEEKKSSAVRWAAEKDKLETCIHWIRTINELHADLETIAKDEIALAARLDDFIPKRERLQLANRAANIEGDYVMLTGLRKQQKDDILALNSLHELIPELEAKITAARDVFDESDKQLLALREENKVLLETTGKVRLMDQEINHKLEYIEKVREQLTKLSNEKEAEADRKTKAEKAIDAFKTDQSVAVLYLKEHAHDAELSTELAGIRATSSNVIESYTQYHTSRIKLDTASKLLESLADMIRGNEASLKQAVIANAADQEHLAAVSRDIDTLLNGRMPVDLQKRKDVLILHLAELQKIADFETERTRLHDGKACPLCGSLHHPFAEGNIPTSSDAEKELAGLIGLLDDLDGLFNELELLKDKVRDSEKTVDKFRNQEANTRQQWLHAAQSVEQLKEEVSQRNTGFETSSKALKDLLMPFQIDTVPLNEQDASALLLALTDRRTRWQFNEKKRMEAAEKIAQEEASLRMAEAMIHSKTIDIEDKAGELRTLDGSLHGLTTTRKEVFGEKVVKDEEERHATLLQDAALDRDQAAESLRMSRQALSDNSNRINDLDARIRSRTPELANGEKHFSRLLAETGFDDEAGFVSKRLTLAERQILEQEARQLDNTQTELQARQHDRKARLAQEKAKNLTDRDMEALNIKHDEARIALNALLEETGALKQRLEENEHTRVRGEEIRQKIETQETVVSRWARLNNLIGSADGKKYRNFAQGLTFEIMVSYANIQLSRLSDRYLLIRDREEPLELNVMDNYQAGEVRSTKNLSGGESFIVSLALALGLSQMSSRNVRVDSLFLDEGFGTLDEDTLETALGTLAGLRQDGKMIGVISHVGAMKERINTKILVQPIREGRSVLSGPGVNGLGLRV